MKVFTLASTLPALTLGYSMSGYDMFGRPVTIRGMGQPRASPSAEHRENVDQAFEDLMKDLEPPASEKSVAKSKEWVDRTFGLFSELNRDVASSENEVDKNEEMLRKQQKWANKVIDFAAELGQDFDLGSDVRPGRWSSNDQEKSSASRRGTVVAPLYSIKDDATVFEVELELPGVSLDDIDIQLEKETNVLVITGQRQSIGSGEPAKFSKRFMLEPTVDTDKISAKLMNGVLTVSAPKEARKDTDNAYQIPVVSGD